MEALSGSIQTLKTTLDAEKHDKEEAKKREAEYRLRLKDTSGQLGESLSELKHIQTTHDAELEKLRLELETAREKHVLESQAWKDQTDAYERQLIEKTQIVTELKAELTELTDREASASSGLKVAAGGTAKDETRRLKARNDELETESKQAQERQSAYETRLAKANVELVEAESSLAESEHKREGTLQELKAESDVLRAQLGTEQKNCDRQRA